MLTLNLRTEEPTAAVRAPLRKDMPADHVQHPEADYGTLCHRLNDGYMITVAAARRAHWQHQLGVKLRCLDCCAAIRKMG